MSGAAATRALAQGVLVLAAAVALGWTIVAVGQAHALGWMTALIGAARAGSDNPVQETLFTLIVFAPMIVVALIGGTIERRNPLAPGRRPGAMLALGLAVGIAGLSVSALDAGLANVLTAGPAPRAPLAVLFWGFGVVALQTAAEEIYFRGWLQPALVTRWGPAAGILAAALAFAALHIAGGARAPLSLVSLFLGGIVFGMFAWRGGGVAGAIGVHLGWNATEQLVFGLDPNPGVGGFGAWWDHDLVGPAWWGGSADGLNGSIGMVMTLLAILAPLLLLRRRGTAGPVPAAQRSAAAGTATAGVRVR